MALGHENKECLRSYVIGGRGEADSNLQCNGVFRGHDQYTIFLHSRPERANFR